MMSEGKPGWACLEATVSGLVQGVGFRFFVQRVAQRHNLSGYVMNDRSGRVKVAAEGPKEALLPFLEELKEGPPLSAVEEVQVNWGEYRGNFHGFSIRFQE
jgi:acylphosphatase